VSPDERPDGRHWPALDVRARAGSAAPPDLDERLQVALDDVAATAIENTAGGWTVYFDAATARDAALAGLRAALGHLVDLAARDVADEGWAVKVQASLGAVRVGRFVVAPPWDAPTAGAGDVIVIEPSLGFGTGHHQSTRLCLRLLQHLTAGGAVPHAGTPPLPLAGRAVLDVGTGSGVLAIAAARLGARAVLGIDNDVDAVTAARDNAARNVTPVSVRLEVADFSRDAIAPADVVLANLTAFVIRTGADRLRALVRHGGTLVTGGFTSDQVPLVTEALAPLRVVQREDEDDWVALQFA
jgi:ribosomal protein L11 methyltransferase